MKNCGKSAVGDQAHLDRAQLDQKKLRVGIGGTVGDNMSRRVRGDGGCCHKNILWVRIFTTALKIGFDCQSLRPIHFQVVTRVGTLV